MHVAVKYLLTAVAGFLRGLRLRLADFLATI
jgi:hypothetical protein